MAFLDDLVTRIVAAGAGVLNTDLFVGANAIIPPGDGPFSVLRETGGSSPTRIQNKSTPSTQRPSAQIVVRAASSIVAHNKARAIYSALDGQFGVTLNSTYYISITATQEPTDLGPDSEVNRVMVGFNVRAEST